MSPPHAIEQEFHRAVPKILQSQAVARLLGIPQTVEMLRRLPRVPGFSDVLRALRQSVEIDVRVYHWAHLPVREPVIVAANHPFPIQDTYCLGAAVEARRPGLPVKVITDASGALFTEVAHLGTFTGHTRAAIRKLASDVAEVLSRSGAICIFPSGEATYRRLGGKVVETDWKGGVIRMARKHAVPVVPAYVQARTGTVYNACRNLLPRALVRSFNLRQAHTRAVNHTIVFGRPLRANEIDESSLRDAVYALSTLPELHGAPPDSSTGASRFRFDEPREP